MLLSFKQNFMETTCECEIIGNKYKIPKEEVEMAKIMLVNLPNNPLGISGFRIYKGKLVMMAESMSAEGYYDYLPVSNIVSYLKKQDISNIKKPDNNLVKGLTRIMQNICIQFRENAFRLYGFDGVFNYLKWAMKKDNKDYAVDTEIDFSEVESIDLTPTKEEFERYSIKEQIFGYNFGFKDGSSFPIHVNTEDIAKFINQQRDADGLDDSSILGGKKWCTCCNNPEKMCPFTVETESERDISFDINENGEFIDYARRKHGF